MNMLLPSQKIFLEKAKTGDILLTSSDAWYSKIIKWKTKSEFNHVGIIYRLFDRRLNIKIPFIIEAISTGVTMQPLINYFKESKNTDLYLFRHKLVNENNLPLIIGKSLEYIGANYDYQQLFALLFNGKIDNDKKMICSQLLDRVYQAGEIRLLHENKVVTPGSIGRDEHLDLIIKTET